MYIEQQYDKYHYINKSTFLSDLAAGKIPNNIIAFIQSTSEIWSHGMYYATNEVYIGKAKDAPSYAKIIIDSENSNDIQVYSKNEIDSIVGSGTLATNAQTIIEAINELKTGSSGDSYELVLNDDGSLQCIKNSTEEGFLLSDAGVLSLS